MDGSAPMAPAHTPQSKHSHNFSRRPLSRKQRTMHSGRVTALTSRPIAVVRVFTCEEQRSLSSAQRDPVFRRGASREEGVRSSYMDARVWVTM